MRAEKINKYPNIEKVINLLNNSSTRNISIFLGIDSIDKSLINLSAIKSRNNDTIIISGVRFGKYFDVSLYIQDDHVTIYESNYEPFYISLSILNNIILESNNYEYFDDLNLYTYDDLIYLGEVKEGLDYLTNSNTNSVCFSDDSKVIFIGIIKFNSLKDDDEIYRVTFQSTLDDNVSASIYYSKSNGEILSGYVSKFIPRKRNKYNKSISNNKYDIDRTLSEAIKVIKEMRLEIK